MLFSVVDDRSGVAYQEYRCVFGEDVETALRFLFNAMAPKQIEGFPFQGIPKMIYLDNGPVARSHVFQQVMRYLDIEVRAHLPQGKRFGPYSPIGGPIPLHRYRAFKKTSTVALTCFEDHERNARPDHARLPAALA